jgi:mRNA interferase MazF
MKAVVKKWGNSEQAGHRPAVVLSAENYNCKTGLMVCCPLTTRFKGYPFEVALASQSGSAVLSDQVKNFDWRARRAAHKGKVTELELRLVRAKLRALRARGQTTESFPDAPHSTSSGRRRPAIHVFAASTKRRRGCRPASA